MNFKKIGIGIMLISLLAGCSKEVNRDALSYELIYEGHLSYPEEDKIPKQTLIFENETEWQNFLPEIERVNPSRAEHLRNMDLNFTQNTLILIIGEFYYYCCSSIIVNEVYKENEVLVVNYRETGPGEATALSQAYLLLKVSQHRDK